MKVLISKKTGIFYYHLIEGDFHSKEGFVTLDEINSGKSKVFSNTGREFMIFEASNYDFSKKLKRGPQLITKKDLGYILARSGLDRNSNVLEAGSGSGAATTFFSGIVNLVKSFDINSDNLKIVKKNIDFMKCSNVELCNLDLIEEIENEKSSFYDLLFLDMPNCHLVLEKNLDLVKNGAFIVCYVPSITQILDITKVIATRDDLYLEEVSEVILRHWKVWDKVARPNHRKEIDHTAFLVFIRKV